MAITYIDKSTAESASSKTAVLDQVTGIQNNDIMLCYVSYFSTGVITPPAGWSNIYNGSANENLFYKIASSESGTYTFTNSASASKISAVIATYRGGFDTTNPIDQSSVNVPAGTSANVTASTITVTAVNSALLYFGSVLTSAGVTTFSAPTSPATFTEDIAIDTSGIGAQIYQEIAHATLSSNGATGNIIAVASRSVATSARFAIAVSLNPGTSGPANLKSYNTNLKANIKTINTNPIANVKTLDTNA
jgi:hypothetical protein